MASRYRSGHEPVPGYRLTEFLGSGAFGEVWKSVGPGGVETAIKIIDLSRKQGTKEFRALGLVKRIHHPNLVPITAFWLKDPEGNILDAESQEAQPINTRATMDVDATASDVRPAELIISMGLGEMNLFDRLEQCQAEGLSAIPIEELLDYMDGSARAIDYLNSPRHDLGKGRIAIQHCDIKPQNIMIVGGGAQVCDFGLARALEDIRMSSAAGSPAYGAPELLRGDKPSATTDQYSLAISYVELRTGELPFDDDSLMGVVNAHLQGNLNLERLSEPERRVIQRATAIDPEGRWPSTVKMVKALREASEGRQIDITDSGEISSGTEILPGYQLVDRLDRSGSEEVWQATASGGEPVALLIRDLTKFGETLDLEALNLICAQLEHPALTKPYKFQLLDKHWQRVDPEDVGGDTASLGKLIVIGQLFNSNLQMRLEQSRRRSDGRRGIPIPELLIYMAQAADGIDHLNAPRHQCGPRRVSLVHCNVRPVNLLLDRGSIKLGNFSQAKIIESDTVAFPNAAMGLEPAYCAPEMLEGKLTNKSDQYALAVTYVQLRTDELPFESLSSSSRQLATLRQEEVDLSQLDEDEAVVVRKALSYAPENRFASCRTFVEALATAVGEVVPEPLGSAPAALPPQRPPAEGRTRTATATMVDSSVSHRDTVGAEVLDTRESNSILSGTVTAAGRQIPILPLAIAGVLAIVVLGFMALRPDPIAQVPPEVIDWEVEVRGHLQAQRYPQALEMVGTATGVATERLDEVRQQVRTGWIAQFDDQLKAGKFQPAGLTASQILASFNGDPHLQAQLHAGFKSVGDTALKSRQHATLGSLLTALKAFEEDDQIQLDLQADGEPLRTELLNQWRETTTEDITAGRYAPAVESLNQLAQHMPANEIRAEVLRTWRHKVQGEYQKSEYDKVIETATALLETFPEDEDAELALTNARKAKDNASYSERLKRFNASIAQGKASLDTEPADAARAFADAATQMTEANDRLQRQEALLLHARAMARTAEPDWKLVQTELAEVSKLGSLQDVDNAHVLVLNALVLDAQAAEGSGTDRDSVTEAILKLKLPEDQLAYCEPWERQAADSLATRIFDMLRAQSGTAETPSAGLKLLEPIFKYHRNRPDFETLLVSAELELQADLPKAAAQSLSKAAKAAPTPAAQAETGQQAAAVAELVVLADQTQTDVRRQQALTDLQKLLPEIKRPSMLKQFCLNMLRVGQGNQPFFVDVVRTLGKVVQDLPPGADKDRIVAESLTGLESQLFGQFEAGKFDTVESTLEAAVTITGDESTKSRFEGIALAVRPLALAFDPQQPQESQLEQLSLAAQQLEKLDEPRFQKAAGLAVANKADKTSAFVTPAIALLAAIRPRLTEEQGQGQIAARFHDLRGQQNLTAVLNAEFPPEARKTALEQLGEDVAHFEPAKAEQVAVEAVQAIDVEQQPELIPAAQQVLMAASSLAADQPAKDRLASRLLTLSVEQQLQVARDAKAEVDVRLDAIARLAPQILQLPPAEAKQTVLKITRLGGQTPALLSGAEQAVAAVLATSDDADLKSAWRELVCRGSLNTADDPAQSDQARTLALTQLEADLKELAAPQRLAVMQDALRAAADGVPRLEEVESLTAELASGLTEPDHQALLLKSLNGAKFTRALRQARLEDRSEPELLKDLQELSEFAASASEDQQLAAARHAQQLAKAQPQLSPLTFGLLVAIERNLSDKELKLQAAGLTRELSKTVIGSAIDHAPAEPDFAQWRQICERAIAAGVDDRDVQGLLAECLSEQILADDTQQRMLWPKAEQALRQALGVPAPPGGDAPDAPPASDEENAQDNADEGADEGADEEAEGAKPDRSGYLQYVRGLVARCAGEQADADEVAVALTAAFATQSAALKNSHRQQRGLEELIWAANRYRAENSDALEVQLSQPFAADDEQLGKVVTWMETAQRLEGDKSQAVAAATNLALAAAWLKEPRSKLTLGITDPLSKAGFADSGNDSVPLMLAHARALTHDNQAEASYAAYEELYRQILARSKEDRYLISDEVAVILHDQVVRTALELGELLEGVKDRDQRLAAWHAARGYLLTKNQYARWEFKDPNLRAKLAFDKAIELDPSKGSYYIGYVKVGLRVNPIDLADLERVIAKGIALDPNDVNALNSMGQVQLLKSRQSSTLAKRTALLNDALGRFNEAYALAKENPEDQLPVCLINVSAAYLELGNYVVEGRADLLLNAEKFAIEATEVEGQIYPEHAYEALGNAKEDLAWLVPGNGEKWEDAHRAFTKAIEMGHNAKHYTARARLGFKRVDSGGQTKPGGDYLEDALADLSQAIVRDPEISEPYYWQGQIKAYQAKTQQGDEAKKLLEQAAEFFSKAIDLDPKWIDAYEQLAKAQSTLGDVAALSKTCQDAIAALPEARARFQYLWLTQTWSISLQVPADKKAELLDLVRELAEDLRQVDPEELGFDPGIQAAMYEGMTYQAQGEFEKSNDAFSKAIPEDLANSGIQHAFLLTNRAENSFLLARSSSETQAQPRYESCVNDAVRAGDLIQSEPDGVSGSEALETRCRAVAAYALQARVVKLTGENQEVARKQLASSLERAIELAPQHEMAWRWRQYLVRQWKALFPRSTPELKERALALLLQAANDAPKDDSDIIKRERDALRAW